MPLIGEKEKVNIQEALIKLIMVKMPKDRMRRELHKVEAINLVHWEIDEENSDRNKLVIASITAMPRIWLKNPYGGTSNLNMQIRNNRPVIFEFDNREDNYKIINTEEVNFINVAEY